MANFKVTANKTYNNEETALKSAHEIFKRLKGGRIRYDEDYHCPLLLKIMLTKGRISAFCTEAFISESTFYNWCNKFNLFLESYELGKMFARELWEEAGDELRENPSLPGVIDHRFEHWKLIGWSRFGISKNSRIKLTLDPNDGPDKHYSQLLIQAAKGDFTAAEIKQLMEAVNVGLRTHDVITLQKEINELRADLILMKENSNGHDQISVK